MDICFGTEQTYAAKIIDGRGKYAKCDGELRHPRNQFVPAI